MHQLELPALLSDSPLGFLAALGVLELTTHTLDSGAHLSWQGPAQPALLHTHSPLTIDRLADHLQHQLPTDPEDEPFPVVPGILSRTRHPTPGSPNEPLRMPFDEAHRQLAEYAHAERTNGAPQARWFTALVNPLHAKNEKNGIPYTTTTPFFAPSGRMTLRQSWAEAATRCRKEPKHLRAALTSWIRVPGYAGASLDHHSYGPAHLHTDGQPAQHGVPGATWLALHAFAHFRLTGHGDFRGATSWVPTREGRTFTWPAWHPPLPTPAITTLLEHPLLYQPNPPSTALTDLGVIAIYTARRTRLSNSDGPLQTARPAWP
ncbi:hypothetical protein [Streptomyces radicis]|uniref:Uncharacterized protein n=1 Tax=Streptomyces radicis TaxID=1750517 RepID=A0A3A9VSH7_9ACTN|nr:hypothetical protein [Streptomyces radicis]RKN03113.1 hypothetical protein D7319_32190 [Streptomyces radicis]RKN13043.1 hypothetical protein D7318_32085 [Streptomyces radicis]